MVNKFVINKFILISFLTIYTALPVYAIKDEIDYTMIYNDLPKIKAEFTNNEDPDEYYDVRKFNVSPYPLIRTSSDLYVQNIKIPPDYYLLTPREYNGKSAILFKQQGKVLFMVPVYKKETINPKLVYFEPPKAKTPLWKKPLIYTLKKMKLLDRYENPVAFPKSKMYAFDVYGSYYEMDLYYEDSLYKMIFKKHPY
jgi:hypothetical protein